MLRPLSLSLALLGLCACAACSRPPPPAASADSSPASAPGDSVAGRELYNGLLRDHVRGGRVDYSALKDDARLAAYLHGLAARDPAALPPAERLAYWINVYNAATLKLVADAWPVASIKDINGGKPWDLPVFQPSGAPAPLTLNQIEHDIIRKEFAEPRVHFALVCAASSCPPLREEEYTAMELEEQLAAQAKAFLGDKAHNRYDPVTNTYVLSPIFKWYAADFGGSEAAVRDFVGRSADPRDVSADQPGPTLDKVPVAGPARLGYSDYDWSLNVVK